MTPEPSAAAQVAAAYRVADTYRVLSEQWKVMAEHWEEHRPGDAERRRDVAYHMASFADDLSDALARAAGRAPTYLTAENLRANVLALHVPVKVWTDSVISDVDDTETEEALYDDAGNLLVARDERTLCEGCGITRNIAWPCPTARAVGVDE